MAPDEIRAFFQMSHIYNQVKDKQDMSLNPEFLEKYKELESKYMQYFREVNGLGGDKLVKVPQMMDGVEAFSCIASIINEVLPQIKDPELCNCVNQAMYKMHDLVTKEKESSNEKNNETT